MILSGTASDGAQGIRAVKTRCGITFSQDEHSARYSSMPHSAIATGAVDFILTPSGIGEELGRIDSHPYLTVPAEDLEGRLDGAESDSELQKILERLKAGTGVDFSRYKLSTIRRRLGRRLVLHHISKLQEYLDYLDVHPGEIHDLYRDILISVTSFFREPLMFEALKKTLQQYVETRLGEDPLRLWIPGCATGEEAYSLAILATEVLEAARKTFPVQIFGTDISDSAIDRARAGIYSERAAEEVSAERLHRYFTRSDSDFRIKQQIRETCVFARHDLTTDPPFSQMDVVSCRNVFIYLSAGLQQQVLPTLHYSLKPGGLLVLGSAETVGRRSDLFATVDGENNIYGKKAVSSRPAPGRTTGRTREAGAQRQRIESLAIPTAQDVEIRAARIMRDLYAPAGVLINEEMQVIHFHGQTGLYLEQAPGEASLNLLRLARESLVYPIRRAVSAAREKKAPVHESGVEVNSNGLLHRVKLSVLPVADDAQFCLVLFEPETDDGVAPEKGKPTAEPTSAELQLTRLERELADTSDYLRKVTEQHSAVTEELRAANEEVRSSNEELQSTNEELRAAKEQLQSSNEELSTVNDELRHSNSELRLASNDLSNILTAATIPILMVGMDLRLRRYTPAAEVLLGTVPGDIGRTVSEVHHAFDVPGLRDMLLETLQTLNARQRRVQNGDGRWYDVFIRPYRTIDDRIEGAVVTFIDVDDAVRALEKAETALTFVEGI
ncbi:MAG TPA: CheR family methyltransferase, partial [Bryobacteraceae bacterium]|nr:CheR family methyltransferase [Bryobacteraceae bacterium]